MDRDPQEEHEQALAAYREASVAYRRAVGAAREQLRAKREWVAECVRRLVAAQKRLAESPGLVPSPDNAMRAQTAKPDE